jgi:hypothetical protein
LIRLELEVARHRRVDGNGQAAVALGHGELQGSARENCRSRTKKIGRPAMQSTSESPKRRKDAERV